MDDNFINVNQLNKKQILGLSKIKRDHYSDTLEEMLSLSAKYIIIAIVSTFAYAILNDLGGGKRTFVDNPVYGLGYWILSAVAGCLFSFVKYKGELVLNRMFSYKIVYNYNYETALSVIMFVFVVGEYLTVGIWSSLYFEFGNSTKIIIIIGSTIYGIVIAYSLNKNRVLSLYTSLHPVIGLFTTFITASVLAVMIVLICGGLCGVGPLILLILISMVPFLMALNHPITLAEYIILFDDDFWNW